MILVADIGGTKGHWGLIDNNKVYHYTTDGYNPYMFSNEKVFINLIGSLKNSFSFDKVEELHYYGSGCNSNDIAYSLSSILNKIFVNASVNVNSDLLAACRATCINNKGVVSILGTGSNSCYYNGKEIVKKINSLGYLLGDEGSGYDMGKEFFRMYKRDLLPKNLYMSFKLKYDKNNTLLKEIYDTNNSSKFVASFSKFILKNENHLFIQNFIRLHFEKYFDEILSKYDLNNTLYFSGSIAFYYKSFLKKIAEERDYKIGKIVLSPIDGISKFHSNKK